MKKFLAALFSVLVCGIVVMCAACKKPVEQKKPEKLKDGISLVLTEGASRNVDLSEYISIEGTDFAYEVSSSNDSIATVSVDGNTATITAVSKGSATVTASADEIAVSFAVTVNEKQQQPEEKPAPVFNDVNIAYDLKDVNSKSVTLTPKSGSNTFSYTYALKEQDSKVTITGNKITVSYEETVEKQLIIVATYTDSENTSAGSKTVDIKLNINVTDTRTPEEVAGADKTLIIVMGQSKEITISDYIDSKNLSGITYEISSANALITVGDVADGKFTVTAGATEEDADVTVTINAKYNGESKLTVTLTLQVKCELQPTVKKQQVTNSVDIYTLENKTELTIDFTQNIESNGVENLVYSVTSEGGAVTLDTNNCLTYNLDGTYSETATEVVFNVVVGYGNDKSVNYTYTLKISDTTAYRVVNGGFDNDLDGWTMDGEMGEISEQSTFWAEEFPIFNNGKYFAGSDPNKGTLTSTEFKVGGINKITFMLGAAGNSECYITLEKADGTVLAIWRNTKFEDVGNWDKDEIGKTQFACNLVTYVADLSDYAGETLKIVLHDNAESGFGFFNFDELITYYAAEADLPENTFDAVNQLANKAELKALVDDALTAQGDYTLESYNEYTAKVTAAQAILDKVSATQAEVDAAKVAIDAAYETLQVRTPAEKTDANKSFSLLVNGNKELAVSDYVDDKELNNLTYEVSSADAKVTVSEIADGKFTVTAGSEEVTGATVSLVVKYKDREVLTVTITVNVTSETTPVLTQTAVSTDIDLYSVENKTDITLDFSSNVENLGELELTYTVTMNGTPITLDGTSYTYTYESYTETATEVVFAVTVSYTHNGNPGELNYNYTLNIKDTRAYRITNGGFENSLDGWTLSNSKLGGVNDDSTYWGNIPFNNDGNFFNAYAEGCREEAIGTLTSSPFTIGGSGWITYKLGGAKNSDKVFIEIVENGTGNILARYYNNAFSDDVESTTVRGCTLVAYKADLSAHIGETVYIRITDNAVSDYGLFFVDSFVTYYPEAPETGYTEAVAVEHPDTIYDIYNGGFESDLAGWTLSGGEIGVITDGDACFTHWAEPHTYGKEGDKLFSFWTWDAAANEGEGGEVNREGNMGTLTSSMFVLKKDKYISFKFGGGNNRNVFIELVNAENGLIVAVFHNDNCNGGRLISYNYKVDELSSDTLCYFRIVDNAVSDWGCFTADAFKTNLDSAPADSVNAVNHISEYRSMVNGSFETGNLDGWTMIGELGAVTDTEKAEGWYQTNESAKDGNNLFTFYYNNGTDYTNVEGNTGIIRSSAFILEKNGIISFRFGAAHNRDVYINVYTTGGKLLAQFRNNAWEQDTVMVQYYYQFDNTEEISCYFEVVDNATDDYGCIVMDDFCVNLEAIPEDAALGSAQTKAERYPAD